LNVTRRDAYGLIVGSFPAVADDDVDPPGGRRWSEESCERGQTFVRITLAADLRLRLPAVANDDHPARQRRERRPPNHRMNTI